MKTIHKILFVFSLSLLLVSCTYINDIQLYPDPPIDSKNESILTMYLGCLGGIQWIPSSIDNYNPSFLGKLEEDGIMIIRFHLLPGEHTIYYEGQNWREGNSNAVLEPITIKFEALPGHEYLFSCGVNTYDHKIEWKSSTTYNSYYKAIAYFRILDETEDVYIVERKISLKPI